MNLPPPWVRYNEDFPGLWRRDRAPPYWMTQGQDSRWHWEFNKYWEQFYKGEGEEWWLRFVPKKVRDRIDYQVKMQVRKMEQDL